MEMRGATQVSNLSATEDHITVARLEQISMPGKGLGPFFRKCNPYCIVAAKASTCLHRTILPAAGLVRREVLLGIDCRERVFMVTFPNTLVFLQMTGSNGIGTSRHQYAAFGVGSSYPPETCLQNSMVWGYLTYLRNLTTSDFRLPGRAATLSCRPEQ